MMPTLILIRGLPGSGKSTLARQLTGSFHLEADQYFVNSQGEYKFNPAKLKEAHENCFKNAEYYLGGGYSVVVANTFSRIWEMQPYIDLAHHLGIPLQVIECQGNFGSIHNVPEETIQRMKERWETYPLQAKS